MRDDGNFLGYLLIFILVAFTALIAGTAYMESAKPTKLSTVVCFDNNGKIILELFDVEVKHYLNRTVAVVKHGEIDIGSSECLIFTLNNTLNKKIN